MAGMLGRVPGAQACCMIRTSKSSPQNYLQQQKYVREHDMVGNAKQDSSAAMPQKKRSHQWIWWTTGAVGVAAVATTAVVLLHEDANSTDASEPFKP
jgi:hypothetical protein